MNLSGERDMRILPGKDVSPSQIDWLKEATFERANFNFIAFILLYFISVSEYGMRGFYILGMRRALLICGLEEQIFRVCCINSSSYQDTWKIKIF